jgi:tetratricopeptide (TPR) repeat protein
VNQAARQAELSGDFAAAEKAYENEVKTRPTADSWQRLGLVRNLQSKFEVASVAFREALRRDPSLWTSRLFLAICLYRLNDFQTARTELELASRQVPSGDPGRDEIDYWLGATLIALSHPLDGLMRLEGLLARKPNRVDALQLATETYASFSSSLWNQVAERNFDSAAGHEVHGHALEAEGDTAGAIEAYQQSQAINPKRSGPGTAIGRILLQRGNPEEASRALNDELRRNPYDPQACYYAGLTAIRQGRMAEAAPLLEIAVNWAAHDPEPAIALAQVYLGLGDRDRAAAAARKALAVAPGNAAATELLQASGQSK